MYDAVKDKALEVREIFENACASIQGWDNDYEMTHKIPLLSESIDEFQRQFYKFQKPLLMQTLWKTQGKSPLLAENAFDIVIWSDYAFSRLFMSQTFILNRYLLKTLFQTKIIKETYLCAMLKKRLQTSICIKSIL